jgi:hypothetical protein
VNNIIDNKSEEKDKEIWFKKDDDELNNINEAEKKKK